MSIKKDRLKEIVKLCFAAGVAYNSKSMNFCDPPDVFCVEYLEAKDHILNLIDKEEVMK